MGRGADAEFVRCVNLLRRGIVSGADVAELLESVERVAGCDGVSLNIGYGIGPRDLCRGIDPRWPEEYLPLAPEDPAPGFLARNGPFAVYSVSKHATPGLWDAPLGKAFARNGYVDAAIMRVGGAPDAVLAAYRPRGLRPYSEITLARLSTLLPMMDLAFGPAHVTGALLAPRDEPRAIALRRLGAYAVLGDLDGEITFSTPARKLFGRLFVDFGPRGEVRIERAVRLAFSRLHSRKGRRVVRLRPDLKVELAWLPEPGSNARLLAVFSEEPPVKGETLLPCDELLSPTQRSVARALVRGASIPSIAVLLRLSPETVKVHVRDVYRRLGVKSRAGLATLYAAEGEPIDAERALD